MTKISPSGGCWVGVDLGPAEAGDPAVDLEDPEPLRVEPRLGHGGRHPFRGLPRLFGVPGECPVVDVDPWLDVGRRLERSGLDARRVRWELSPELPQVSVGRDQMGQGVVVAVTDIFDPDLHRSGAIESSGRGRHDGGDIGCEGAPVVVRRDGDRQAPGPSSRSEGVRVMRGRRGAGGWSRWRDRIARGWWRAARRVVRASVGVRWQPSARRGSLCGPQCHPPWRDFSPPAVTRARQPTRR